MLTEARNVGIVKIEIENFDTNMFKLENYVKEKYSLESLEIIQMNLMILQQFYLKEFLKLQQASLGI